MHPSDSPAPPLQVPYLTKKPFQITPEYTVPKNSMIIPSFWNSLHDEHVYPEPDSFIPERWMPLPEGGVPLAEQSPQNYLVWGSGPHKVGRLGIVRAISLTPHGPNSASAFSTPRCIWQR